MIGLGKMGGNMVKRLIAAGHAVVAFDLDDEHLRAAASDGAVAARSVPDLVEKLAKPRAVWVMVPHGEPTTSTIDTLLEHLDRDDAIVDGGNSRYVDSVAAAERCGRQGVHFLDAGVSGGVWGLEEGYCLMVGGPEAAFKQIEPVFAALAPDGGYARVGASGAGHFVKMVHNAIEYAMLQALGEGFECLYRSDFELDLEQVAELWRHGAVVRSWLLDLLAQAFAKEGTALPHVAGYVADSGMGRWSVEYAVEHAIPIPVITQSLYERFQSRLDERFSAKVIAALRDQFGGHGMKRS
jgi:6-phosphogluconate dehydrogenase